MDRIVIQVDDYAGKIYRQLSSDKQLLISEALSLMLKKASNDSSAKSYKELLDEFGQQALAKGLTSEILEALLKKDD
jgi:hypothetical protein